MCVLKSSRGGCKPIWIDHFFLGYWDITSLKLGYWGFHVEFGILGYWCHDLSTNPQSVAYKIWILGYGPSEIGILGYQPFEIGIFGILGPPYTPLSRECMLRTTRFPNRTNSLRGVV